MTGLDWRGHALRLRAAAISHWRIDSRETLAELQAAVAALDAAEQVAAVAAQGDLFAAPLGLAETPHAKRDTSIEAAASVARGKRAETLRDELLLYLFRINGASDQRAASVLKISGNTLRPRRRELVKRGLVVDSGRREQIGLTGRKATVWITTDAGDVAAHAIVLARAERLDAGS